MTPRAMGIPQKFEQLDIPFSRDDIVELMKLVTQLRGFPSHDSDEVYGVDAKPELQTFEIQWTYEEEDPAGGSISDVTSETRQTSKDICDSFEAGGR